MPIAEPAGEHDEQAPFPRTKRRALHLARGDDELLASAAFSATSSSCVRRRSRTTPETIEVGGNSSVIAVTARVSTRRKAERARAAMVANTRWLSRIEGESSRLVDAGFFSDPEVGERSSQHRRMLPGPHDRRTPPVTVPLSKSFQRSP